ncbi:uncharacterized protein LOC128559103 isoform X2 [Mercenaria mercenaria]|uniref:uncharacterized protein LOC128559103 isoform X2 n=1 Tax=Mercenaria mercenaria TaxID=6596 RepID=UPI00234E6EE3|nr:uncharacterized protein LOC128559103 isoform X2 [Mercenaria mercenaria]
MDKWRSMLYKICFCKLICIFSILAYVCFKREPKITNTFQLKIEPWYPDDTDESFEQLRNACLSGKGLLYDKRIVHMITNRLQYNTMDDVIECARDVQKYYDVVLVNVINDAYSPFAYSWLCNTAEMDIHKSVLIITLDTTTRDNLITSWNKLNVFALDIDDIPAGDQGYSRASYVKIMIRRTQIMYFTLQVDINLLLLEFDYVWFSNPLPEFNGMSEIDMLLNPVSLRDENVSNGGLIFIYATDRSKFLWKKLTEMMIDLGERIKNNSVHTQVSEYENDQVYLSKLVRES